MQQLPSPLGAGLSVQVRARRWTIDGVEHGEGADAVDLVAAERDIAGRRLTLLAPFDDFQPGKTGDDWQVTREGAAVGIVATTIASAIPWPAPEVARTATIDLLPHQLSACLALKTARARMVLVADPVGSGKTIQAGLALADLCHRHQGARALVLVPAGLRDQWRVEMQSRFSLELRDVDGSTWRNDDASLDSPAPWEPPGAVLASFDYVKRPEVLASLDAIPWDLIVVDEAHHAAAGTDRGAAIRALCRRAMSVLLLTATPHDGHDGRFESLCELGRLHPEEPFLLLRRARATIGGHGHRRSHLIEVTPSTEEVHARRLLLSYVHAMREAAARAGSRDSGVAALLAAIFTKRAASSPAALARTARRRLEILAAPPHIESQPLLPFLPDDGADEPTASDADDERVLSLRGPLAWHRERAWLGALADAAGRAATASPKLRALHRLLGRAREPAIVFTEYRDTLAWLQRTLPVTMAVSCLHGLQTPQERAAELSAFESGRSRLLLATDVAAEGLNLHHRCRLVIEFDRPWTPLRSEQRAGRVDRIGQRRRVHTWALLTKDEVDLRLEEVSAARRSAASRGVAQHPDLCEIVGPAEREAHLAIAAARGLLGRLPARAVERSERCLRGSQLLVSFASARRRHALGLRQNEVLVLVDAAATTVGRLVETAPVVLRVTVEGCLATTTAAALREVRRQTATTIARVLEPRLALLQQSLAAAADLDTRRARLVEAALREHVTQHFAQPDLFGYARRRNRVETTFRLPTSPGGTVVALVTRTVLVVAPRQWTPRRGQIFNRGSRADIVRADADGPHLLTRTGQTLASGMESTSE